MPCQAHEVSRRALITKGPFRYQGILCGICGEFNPERVRLEFLVNKVALGQVFIRELLFCPVSIIAHIVHIN
jgi:hypothetical protein